MLPITDLILLQLEQYKDEVYRLDAAKEDYRMKYEFSAKEVTELSAKVRFSQIGQAGFRFFIGPLNTFIIYALSKHSFFFE